MRLSTRTHGLIDYAVGSALGMLALSSPLSTRTRRVLGAVGAFHLGYAALTDYEAGVTPGISMRQHLALDALGGAAVVGAGLLMRREPRGTRTLLIAVGLSELAVTALSSAQPVAGPGQGSGPIGRILNPTGDTGQVGYEPLDAVKSMAEDLFVVDSVMHGVVPLPVRMTVIRLPDGGLLLHSPTPFRQQVRRELQALGPVRHIVAPNVVHWIHIKEWQSAYPDATVWAAPGLRDRGQVRRSGVRLDRDIGEAAPSDWQGVIETVTVPGSLGFREVAFFHRPTCSLVVTDLVINFERDKMPNAIRPLLQLLGSVTPYGMPPPYLRAIIKGRREDAASAVNRLLALRPERVIMAHGRPFETHGMDALRRSLRWLLD